MFKLLKLCYSNTPKKSLNLLKVSGNSGVAKLHVGQSIEVKRTVTQDDLQQFINISGDDNKIHTANEGNLPVVHGALLNGLVSGVIGTKLPGHGTLLLEQTLRFPNSCYINEEITITVVIESVKRIVTCSFFCSVLDSDNNSKIVLKGNAKLLYKKNSE